MEVYEEEKKEISVAQRQVMILSILSDNPLGFTIDELLERVNKWGAGAKKRTISRDIDELSLSYAIIEEERDRKTYYKANKFNMKNVDLTVSDMIAISFMEKILKPYQNVQIGKTANKIISRIKENAGSLNREFISSLSDTINVDDVDVKDDVIAPKIEKLIRSSIDKKNVVRIEYVDWKSGKVSVREIHPLRILFIDKRMSVEAFCEMRNDIRVFRLSRIQDGAVLKRNFEIPENYNPDSNEKFIHLRGGEACELKVKFIGETAKYIKEYDSDKADKITELEDGILFEKKTAITDEVRRYIMSFGKDVKIIEPESLKEDVKKEILAMYNEIS